MSWSNPEYLIYQIKKSGSIKSGSSNQAAKMFSLYPNFLENPKFLELRGFQLALINWNGIFKESGSNNICLSSLRPPLIYKKVTKHQYSGPTCTNYLPSPTLGLVVCTTRAQKIQNYRSEIDAKSAESAKSTNKV